MSNGKIDPGADTAPSGSQAPAQPIGTTPNSGPAGVHRDEEGNPERPVNPGEEPSPTPPGPYQDPKTTPGAPAPPPAKP